MFWICAGSRGDNRDFSVAAEQSLHRLKAFSAPHLTPLVRRLGVHKELGRDTGRTAAPTDPRDVPDHIASCLVCKAGRRRRKWGHLEL